MNEWAAPRHRLAGRGRHFNAYCERGLNETAVPTTVDWENLWAPYDEQTYTAVLDQISPNDIVLDIGAGDLRLTRRLAARAKAVYAIEQRPDLVDNQAAGLPANLEVIIGDARQRPFPTNITAAVLLMRHCTHLQLYWNKLRGVGCSTLITNARWGLGVEIIDLNAPRLPFATVALGWYACSCGATGFVPGPPAALTSANAEILHEVSTCPHCTHPEISPA